jgi:hypothetical protein
VVVLGVLGERRLIWLGVLGGSGYFSSGLGGAWERKGGV